MFVGGIMGGDIMGGDISPDGRRIVLWDYLRGYRADGEGIIATSEGSSAR